MIVIPINEDVSIRISDRQLELIYMATALMVLWIILMFLFQVATFFIADNLYSQIEQAQLRIQLATAATENAADIIGYALIASAIWVSRKK